MDVTSHSTTQRCDGRFESTILFEEENEKTGKYRFTRGPNPQNINNLAHDITELDLSMGDKKSITVTGELNDPCDKGEFVIEWVEVIDQNEIESSRDDVLIVVPDLPLTGTRLPDPVTANPAGEFEYVISLDCCQGNAGDHTLQIGSGEDNANIKKHTTDPVGPITVHCPNGDDVVVEGVLSNPSRTGYLGIIFSGNFRCSFYTTIEPSQ